MLGIQVQIKLLKGAAHEVLVFIQAHKNMQR